MTPTELAAMSVADILLDLWQTGLADVVKKFAIVGHGETVSDFRPHAAALEAKITVARDEGRREARAEFVAAVKLHCVCRCEPAWTGRGRHAPDCEWNNIARELLTEEELAGPAATPKE